MDDREPPLSRLIARLVERSRATPFVPGTDEVVLDGRRHPVMLALPGARTLVGLLLLLTGWALWPLLLLALLTAAWTRGRLRSGLRRSLVVGACVAVGEVLLRGLVGPAWCALALLGWGLEDAADWWTDRLVVTNRRVYRCYGVLTRHTPSVALTGIAFLDASVPPLGRLFGYGTLLLDSAAQDDAPLSRLSLLPDVVPLSHEILRLRAAAMPRFPMPPG